MKKLFSMLFATSALLLTAQNTAVTQEQTTAEPQALPVTVKGKVNVSDFLNVRLGPGLRHPVTGRLNPDQEIEIIRIAGNWLEIKAPETLKIYVSEARVNLEGKLSGELNMRSRMDSAAPSYGLLPAGTVVKRLPERRNGWLRIVPPADLKVYVAAICVTFDRSKFDDKGLPLGAVTAAAKAEEVKAPAAEVKTEEVKAPAAEVKTEEAKAPAAEVKTEEVKAPAAEVKTEEVKTPATVEKTSAL